MFCFLYNSFRWTFLWKMSDKVFNRNSACIVNGQWRSAQRMFRCNILKGIGNFEEKKNGLDSQQQCITTEWPPVFNYVYEIFFHVSPPVSYATKPLWKSFNLCWIYIVFHLIVCLIIFDLWILRSTSVVSELSRASDLCDGACLAG